jgi:two-component system heavy metal sensor histidine kinase CusS
LIEEAGVTLDIEGDADALIEPALFRRAITNLLYNAIQHGARDSVIQIRIAKVDDFVSIQISNHGKPIGNQHLDRLFDRFYRVDAARSDSQNSHGLGLAIVKAVATMHGGTVFARSNSTLTTIGLTVAHAI